MKYFLPALKLLSALFDYLYFTCTVQTTCEYGFCSLALSSRVQTCKLIVT